MIDFIGATQNIVESFPPACLMKIPCHTRNVSIIAVKRLES